MLDNNRPLPWSARRYTVTGIGEVITKDGEILEPSKKNGELFLKLDWVLGYREYSVALLVLVSFGLVRLPDHLLEEVVPLYKDGSASNLAPCNLLYKFKSGKVEVEEYPGFYYIPFYVNYAINAHGDLINISTGKFKSWSITKPNVLKNQIGGYFYSRVVNDLGFSQTLFKHRALCYVFKEYGADVNALVVNHLDGNPGNNALNNLELVTYQRNNIHAVEIGLRGDNRPVLSRNVETGEVIRFDSINACGRHYGQPRAGFVIHRLVHGGNKVYPNKLQFKFDDGLPWLEVDLEKAKLQRVGVSNAIQARNVFTGEILVFEGTSSGVEITGVKAATILSHVRDKKVIPTDGWNFRYHDTDLVWPQHSERHLKVYAKFPIYPADAAVVYDTKSDKERFFESVSLACQSLRITKHVFYYCAKNSKLLSDRYRLELFKLRENLSHPAE
jgi:HNH endonuclease